MHAVNGDDWAMRRCFDLANRARAYTKTNPMVGAVLMSSKDRVKTEGYHHGYGLLHAEVDALSKKNINIVSTDHFYVSLEPCIHYGKTPPCAPMVLQQDFEQCTISNLDPNPQVHGKGAKMLREGGKLVKISHMETVGKNLIRAFYIQQKWKRPYIILKWAQSIDGYLGAYGLRTKLSHPLSDRLVHKWRAECQAILVGSKTVIVDQPSLDNRLFYGPSPFRITIDRDLKISEENPFFRRSGKAIRFSCKERLPAHDSVMEIQLQEKTDMLEQVLQFLHEWKIGTLLVEGGATLLSEFLRHNLWDECRIITSSKVLARGVKAPHSPEGPITRICMGSDQIENIQHGISSR